MSDPQHEQRLNRMKYAILTAEQENLKTRAKSTNEMVDMLYKIIVGEAKKFHGVKRHVD